MLELLFETETLRMQAIKGRLNDAIWAVENTQDKHFDMDDWFAFRDPQTQKEVGAQTLYRRQGYLPCGTVSCLAGTLQYTYAVKKERKMSAFRFGMEFLYLTRHGADLLFTEEEFYNRPNLKDVTRKDVINKLKSIRKNLPYDDSLFERSPTTENYTI